MMEHHGDTRHGPLCDCSTCKARDVLDKLEGRETEGERYLRTIKQKLDMMRAYDQARNAQSNCLSQDSAYENWQRQDNWQRDASRYSNQRLCEESSNRRGIISEIASNLFGKFW